MEHWPVKTVDRPGRRVASLWVALLVAGCATGQSSSSPPRPAATTAATTATNPEPGGGARELVLDLDAIYGGPERFPTITLTNPKGWRNIGWGVSPGPGADIDSLPSVMAVQFWEVAEVYGHPCQWSGTLFDPGPTVDDLAAALLAIPLRDVTAPEDVTIDGYHGKKMELSVPVDADYTRCDSTEGMHHFDSWTWPEGSWASHRRQEWPGQVDHLWILDVDGLRLVIDATYYPAATAEDRAKLFDVVESIRFD